MDFQTSKNIDHLNIGLLPSIFLTIILAFTIIVSVTDVVPEVRHVLSNIFSGISLILSIPIILLLPFVVMNTFKKIIFLREQKLNLNIAKDFDKKLSEGLDVIKDGPVKTWIKEAQTLIEQGHDSFLGQLRVSYLEHTDQLVRTAESITPLLLRLGILGTFVGLLYSMGGMREFLLNTASSVQSPLGQMIFGMISAFGTSIVGAFCFIIGRNLLEVYHSQQTDLLTQLEEFTRQKILPESRLRGIPTEVRKEFSSLSSNMAAIIGNIVADKTDSAIQEIKSSTASVGDLVRQVSGVNSQISNVHKNVEGVATTVSGAITDVLNQKLDESNELFKEINKWLGETEHRIQQSYREITRQQNELRSDVNQQIGAAFETFAAMVKQHSTQQRQFLETTLKSEQRLDDTITMIQDFFDSNDERLNGDIEDIRLRLIYRNHPVIYHTLRLWKRMKERFANSK